MSIDNYGIIKFMYSGGKTELHKSDFMMNLTVPSLRVYFSERSPVATWEHQSRFRPSLGIFYQRRRGLERQNQLIQNFAQTIRDIA